VCTLTVSELEKWTTILKQTNLPPTCSLPQAGVQLVRTTVRNIIFWLSAEPLLYPRLRQAAGRWAQVLPNCDALVENKQVVLEFVRFLQFKSLAYFYNFANLSNHKERTQNNKRISKVWYDCFFGYVV
jgi:hypothetical protein